MATDIYIYMISYMYKPASPLVECDAWEHAYFPANDNKRKPICIERDWTSGVQFVYLVSNGGGVVRDLISGIKFVSSLVARRSTSVLVARGGGVSGMVLVGWVGWGVVVGKSSKSEKFKFGPKKGPHGVPTAHTTKQVLRHDRPSCPVHRTQHARVRAYQTNPHRACPFRTHAREVGQGCRRTHRVQRVRHRCWMRSLREHGKRPHSQKSGQTTVLCQRRPGVQQLTGGHPCYGPCCFLQQR